MKRFHYWLIVGLSIAGFSIACGDDDGGGGTDAAVAEDSGVAPPKCPSGDLIPDDDGLMGACCYRVSNADRTDNPEYRLSALSISKPESISGPIRNALTKAIDEERFNWLLRVQNAGADGAITLQTGFGKRNNSDVTFSFANGDAPCIDPEVTECPDEVNRWDPLNIDATLTGESFSAPTVEGEFTVPILENDGVAVVLELPLRSFTVNMATMSEERSCIGRRIGNSYNTDDGSLQAYVTVADAAAGMVEVPPISTSLCNVLAGRPVANDECTDVPKSEWPVPADAFCDNTGCVDTCEVADCNAWKILGGFTAHGVEITP